MLRQEEMENMNGPITSTEIETVILIVLKERKRKKERKKERKEKCFQDQMASHANSTKNLEKS